MFDSVRSFLGAIGFCTMFYAAARLLHYFELILEDNSAPKYQQYILISLTFLFNFLSLPVSVVMRLINQLHNQRIAKKNDAALRQVRTIGIMDRMSDDDRRHMAGVSSGSDWDYEVWKHQKYHELGLD